MCCGSVRESEGVVRNEWSGQNAGFHEVCNEVIV